MQIVRLCQRDHPFHQRFGGFRLRNRCRDPLFFDDVGDEPAKQRATGTKTALEFNSSFPMSHRYSSALAKLSSSAAPYSAGEAGGAPPTRRLCASNFMPKFKPRPERISLISLSDLRPKFFVRNISDSLF